MSSGQELIQAFKMVGNMGISAQRTAIALKHLGCVMEESNKAAVRYFQAQFGSENERNEVKHTYE